MGGVAVNACMPQSYNTACRLNLKACSDHCALYVCMRWWL